MSKNDYSDEDDYYSQNLEKEGFVSIWIGILSGEIDSDLDVLQDLCGVGYYSLDNQEGNNIDFKMIKLRKLLHDLSYSKSFINEVVNTASKSGIDECRWVIAQYDFDYTISRIKRTIAEDPIFIGSFKYSENENL